MRLAEKWELVVSEVLPDEGEDIIRNYKRFFFTGALVMLEAMDELGEMPQQKGIRELTKLYRETRRFFRRLQRGEE